MFSSILDVFLKTSFWTLQKRGRRVLKRAFCKVWWSWWAYWGDSSETVVAVTVRMDLLQDCGPWSGHVDGRVEHLQDNPLDDATAGGPVRLAHQAGTDWRLRLQQHAAAGRRLCGWFPWWAAPRFFQACSCLQVSQAGYDLPDKMWLIRPLVADRSAKQVITHLTKCDLLIDHWWLIGQPSRLWLAWQNVIYVMTD